jgi:uncharacterized alpha-E superfamily protein
LLSRVANSIYWMSRYIERAENIARFIDVNLQLTLDRTGAIDEQWLPLISVTGDADDFFKRNQQATRQDVMRFLTLDKSYPNSIAACVAAARENARTIRETITSEMWQQINALNIMVLQVADDAIRADRPQGFYAAIKAGSLLFAATTDATMSHATGWNFCRLGRMLERADKTSRILDVKYFLLLPSPDEVGGPTDIVQWAALLRSAGALEMYRQKHGPIAPKHVAGFLILDPDFPRSLTYCLLRAEQAITNLIGPGTPATDVLRRRLGRLRSELLFGDIDEIMGAGLHEYLDNVQLKLNDIDKAMNDCFFQFGPAAEPYMAALQGNQQ